MPHVLFVCTGNRCRSPLAEGFLRDVVQRERHEVVISSAGLMPGGVRADPHAVIAAAKYNVDIAQHMSTEITVELLESADLVVAMERMHVRSIAVLHRSALGKTFTLKELARNVAPGLGLAYQMQEQMRELAARRSTGDLLGTSEADDVADPIGLSQKVFDHAAKEIKTLVFPVGLTLNNW